MIFRGRDSKRNALVNGKIKPPEDRMPRLARWADRIGCQVAVPNTGSRWVGEKKWMKGFEWREYPHCDCTVIEIESGERKKKSDWKHSTYLRVLLQWKDAKDWLLSYLIPWWVRSAGSLISEYFVHFKSILICMHTASIRENMNKYCNVWEFGHVSIQKIEMNYPTEGSIRLWISHGSLSTSLRIPPFFLWLLAASFGL